MTKNLENQCEQVLAGRISFTAFYRATYAEFTRMANHLLRRWPAPVSTAAEDVAQDLFLGAHGAMFGDKPWDPSRGVPLVRFVVYNAMSYAKRRLHKARGAKLSGSADRNASHFEMPLSTLGRSVNGYDNTFGETYGETLRDRMVSEEPSAEQALVADEQRRESIARALVACETPRERLAIFAIEQGHDVDGAGTFLYDDFPTRIALRLGSEEHAVRYVMRAAETVAQRLDATTAS